MTRNQLFGGERRPHPRIYIVYFDLVLYLSLPGTYVPTHVSIALLTTTYDRSFIQRMPLRSRPNFATGCMRFV